MNLDEQTVHFQESITSLNRAWRTFCELEKAPLGNAIWSAAYRMMIVEYCKPFTSSQINESKRHKLPPQSLTDDGKILHTRLLDLRNQVMAHSDLTVLDVNVCYDQTAEFPVPLIVKNIMNNFPDVGERKKQVEAVLDFLYHKKTQYELR